MSDKCSSQRVGAELPGWLLWGYRVLWCLMLPFVLMRMYWRGRRVSGYRAHWGERFGRNCVNGPVDLWWHAVSVGEVMASIPTLKKIREQNPSLKIWVSVTTPTGRFCAMERLAEFDIAYAPFDFAPGVGKVFRSLKPKLIVLMETELWPELLHQANQHQVPVMLVNARMSAKSCQGYQRLGRLTRTLLRSLNYIGAQAELDAERFRTLGAPSQVVSVMGNLKFDFPDASSTIEQGQVIRKDWPHSTVWLAASTHPGEEQLVLMAHKKIRETFADALLVLVPRHPDRFDAVAQLIDSYGFSCARRSKAELPEVGTAVYLGDTMGELMNLMGTSDAVFVGGSLVPHGGHNLLEPVLCKVPVLTGPYTHNFTHVHQLLESAQGVVTIADENQLAASLCDLFQDKSQANALTTAAQRVLLENQGAQDRVLKKIAQLLEQQVLASGCARCS